MSQDDTKSLSSPEIEGLVERLKAIADVLRDEQIDLVGPDDVGALRQASSLLLRLLGEREEAEARSRETFQNAVGWQDRATQAEASLAEAVKLLKQLVSVADAMGDATNCGVADDTIRDARTFLKGPAA